MVADEGNKNRWREVVEVIVDILIDCVHNVHNSDNAPHRDKMVADCYPGNLRDRKSVV